MQDTAPPLSRAMLQRLVLRYRRNAPAAALGPHLRRAQGHSLEFRDYRAYQPGDDIRTVDWRASLRRGETAGLLVRSFEAEKRLTLAVLIDNRPEMLLPETAPKLLFALWALRALAELALAGGDDVLLARLFSGAGQPSVTLRGTSGPQQAARWAEALWHAGDVSGVGAAPAFADLTALERQLQPASAVVVISDLLFDDRGGRFAAFLRAAQMRRRSVSILHLDSFAHEAAMLRQLGQFRLLRPDAQEDPGPLRHDAAVLAEAGAAIAEHLRALRREAAGPGLDWPAQAVQWPATDGFEKTDLRDLFAQSFPALPLLRGLGLGGQE
ncbi:DUF58 domain-containing protein [Rhodobacter capsulatus]|uniref:DUF58 domain-containing protein n=1 Tax=Rhodobacter capsulatus TaxID=1061 RepID=UPI000ABF68BE|nr:DUF58 domain-containing protein [Rhodobacter capsulatus]PZX26321.1 uncharacterized protein DUF58 [Rhodobacter capsulatus]QNR61814.1 DUF58 domain-containing protein [Rhodobacter capsulatus]